MRQRLWLWIVLGIILALVGTSLYISRVNSSHPAIWAMAGGDSGHRNATRQPLPANPKLLWSYNLGSDLRQQPSRSVTLTAPVVWEDGTVYIGLGSKVHAITPEGKRKWAWESRTPLISIALGRQGTLYALTEGTLYAMNPDGTMQWQTDVSVRLSEAMPLVVGQGGTIYVTGAEYMTAVSSTGERKWRFHGGRLSTLPAELPDGKVAVMIESTLYLLTRNGDTVWDREVTDPVNILSISTAGDRIYVVGKDERVAVNKDGSIAFRGGQGRPVTQALALGKDFVQDGVDRYSSNWESQVWSLSGKVTGIQNSVSIVDGAGNVAVISVVMPVRGRNTYLTSFQGFNAKGEQKWEIADIYPAGALVSAGKGRLALIGFLPDQDGTYLLLVGDK